MNLYVDSSIVAIQHPESECGSTISISQQVPEVCSGKTVSPAEASRRTTLRRIMMLGGGSEIGAHEHTYTSTDTDTDRQRDMDDEYSIKKTSFFLFLFLFLS